MKVLPLRVRITALVVITTVAILGLVVVLGGVSSVEDSVAETTLESSSSALAETDAALREHGDQIKSRIRSWGSTGNRDPFEQWEELPGLNVLVINQQGRSSQLIVEDPISIGPTYQCQIASGSISCTIDTELEDDVPAWMQREIELRAEEVSDGVPAVVHGFSVESASGVAVLVRLDTDIFAATEVEVSSGVEELAIVVLPLLLVVVGAITWFSLGRALRPVESMTAQVDRISAESLHQRVPVPEADDELQHLANTMNRMLDRLQRSSERQKQFISDASHELRSPITATGVTLEVARSNPAGADWQEVASVVEEENTRLASLVDDLLLLARLDEGERPAPNGSEAVDLEELCLAEADRPRSVDVSVRVIAPARIAANLATTTRAIRNLIDNAATHAESQVHIEVDGSGPLAQVTVRDDGSGVPLEFADQIFERFVRVDQSRARDGRGGAGLGLAIARRVAEGHGGTLELVQTSGSGATFVLRLPR